MLSADDREWLEDKFNRVHARIDSVETRAQKRDSDIHALDNLVTALKAAGCPSVAAHEDKHHDPVKKWGILGVMVGVFTGIIEGIKHFWKGS